MMNNNENLILMLHITMFILYETHDISTVAELEQLIWGPMCYKLNLSLLHQKKTISLANKHQKYIEKQFKRP